MGVVRRIRISDLVEGSPRAMHPQFVTRESDHCDMRRMLRSHRRRGDASDGVGLYNRWFRWSL